MNPHEMSEADYAAKEAAQMVPLYRSTCVTYKGVKVQYGGTLKNIPPNATSRAHHIVTQSGEHMFVDASELEIVVLPDYRKAG